MNKSLYNFGIFMLGMSIVVSGLQGILYLILGGQVFMLESFMGWFWVATVTSVSASLILLKYYRYREYTFTFSIAIVSMLVNLCQQTMFYFIVSGAREWHRYYVPFIFLVLVSGIVYGLSLIFSSAGQRPWLKRAGIFMFLITSVLLGLIMITFTSSDMQTKLSLEKTTQWIGLIGNVIPVLFILNFFDEVKKIKRESANVVIPHYVESVLGLLCMIVFALALTFGLLISNESHMKLYWQTKNAEQTEKFVKLGEERSFTNDKGETLKYLLLKPKEYDPHKKYPLVVSLPLGTYESPPAQWLASDANRYKYPAFLFVPFCPEGAGWGGIPNYPTIDTLVFDAIFNLEKEMSIDINRRYVSGVSRGGYGSWHFITTRPDMFAAAIPVCGGGDPQLASTIVDVSVWAFHGTHDRNVPVSGTRDMIDAIKKAGGNPKYTEFSDKAHDIWYEVSQTNGLWDWLFEQKRNSLHSMN
ncbi:MAG: peptidase [Chryseolinea sp.]